MASVTAHAPNAGLAEGLSTKTIASLRGIISNRLRNEDLRVIRQFRDNSLQLMDHDSDIARICRQQQQLFWERTWHDHLHILRRELPNALNEILDTLEEEFGGRRESTPLRPEQKRQSSAPLTPQSASKEYAFEVTVANGVSKAPITPTEGVGLATGGRSPESATLPRINQSEVNGHQQRRVSTTSFTEAGSPEVPSPVLPSNKRSFDHEENSKESNKRAKNNQQDYSLEKRLLTLAQLKGDECIFRYRNCEGFYVLRCVRDRCKKAFGRDMVYFQSNPFKWDRAMAHFSLYGHGAKETEKIFHKYAWRVTDATEERNLEGLTGNRPAPPPKAHQSPDALTSPPKSPVTTRDKGKGPEKLINDFVRKTMSKNGASTSGPSKSGPPMSIPSSEQLPSRSPSTARKDPNEKQHPQQRDKQREEQPKNGNGGGRSGSEAATNVVPKEKSTNGDKPNDSVTVAVLPPGSSVPDSVSYEISEEEDEEFPSTEKLFNLRRRKDLSYEDVPLAADEFLN
ncbi:hypothetical protein F5X99DRAFT_407115 [Biscogniauxia marginata]|nr:hypothetical protein F5X99DRAFT_407115 [Biscogniauxia marginata]